MDPYVMIFPKHLQTKYTAQNYVDSLYTNKERI